MRIVNRSCDQTPPSVEILHFNNHPEIFPKHISDKVLSRTFDSLYQWHVFRDVYQLYVLKFLF